MDLQVVADIEETFLPMADDLVVNLADSRAVVDALLDSLPQMFAGNTTVRPLLLRPGSLLLLRALMLTYLSESHADDESQKLEGLGAAVEKQTGMQVESAFGPALQAAYTVMQDYGGKMLVFQNAVPSLGVPLPILHCMC